MAKEFERQGVPTVLVTAVSPLAQSLGANRIVRGKAVPNPFGNPDLGSADEYAYRMRVLERALGALRKDVTESTVFEVRE